MRQAHRKPDRDKLDQYLYDYGYEKTLEMFGLTEKQFDRIMFAPPEKKPKPNDNIDHIVDIVAELDFEKAFPLLRIMRKKYSALRKQYLKNRDLNQINIRAETPEDKFHNALIRILEDTDRFEYKTDKQTYNFIKARLFWEHKRVKKDDTLKKNKLFTHLKDTEQLEQLINNLKNTDND